MSSCLPPRPPLPLIGPVVAVPHVLPAGRRGAIHGDVLERPLQEGEPGDRGSGPLPGVRLLRRRVQQGGGPTPTAQSMRFVHL